jgi:anti-sigma28 factor (negative regulator of flagellin synthesis)
MKIRPTNGTETTISSRARELRDASAQELAKKKAQTGTSEEEGTVRLGLGREINKTLDVADIALERRARVEELKRQVQDKTYEQPSSEALAKSMGEEIMYEIFTSRNGTGS